MKIKLALVFSVLLTATLIAQPSFIKQSVGLEAIDAAKKEAIQALKKEQAKEVSQKGTKSDIPTTVVPNLSKPQQSQIESYFSERSETDSQFFSPFLDNSSEPMADKSSGDDVKQFGYQFFQRAGGADFSDPWSIPVGDEYILGAGDELLIYVWGKVESEFEVKIDATGAIYLPNVGQLNLNGLSLGKARQVLNYNFSQHYVNFDLSVNVINQRKIKVFVLGEVTMPGAYEVSSLSTLISALYMAKGPTSIGSLRDVQIIKRDGRNYTVDLYEYLMEGDTSQDKTLEAYDTILVPVIGSTVKVQGQVKRPGIFEIESNTTLKSALEVLAGGYLSTFYGKRVSVERIESGKYFKVADVLVSEPKKLSKFVLNDGDLITVEAIDRLVKNKVSIQGAVTREGVFDYSQNKTLAQLLQSADGLLGHAYKKDVLIYRFSDSDSQKKVINLDLTSKKNYYFPLKEFDQVQVFNEETVYGTPEVSISGYVNKPGPYVYLDGMRLGDALVLAGVKEYKTISTVDIYRKDGGHVRHLRQDISGYPSIADEQNILLHPEDKLIVREPDPARKELSVKLNGMVQYPGQFVFSKPTTLTELIEHAGGFLPEAYAKGLIFKRDSVKVIVDSAANKAILEEYKRLAFERKRTDSELASYPSEMKEALTFLEQKLADSEGRLLINYAKIKSGEEADILLKNGDIIEIPTVPSEVHVAGAVLNPTSMMYISGESLHYYLDRAGGLSDFSNPNKILIISPDGTVQKRSQLEPGDTIYVGYEVRIQMDLLTFIKEVTQILFNIGSTVAFVNSLSN